MEHLLGNLKYSIIEFKFYAEHSIKMQYWIGAVVRNRFLYAAESVHDERGRSLREIIDTLPLEEQHFMYRQLCGGFPKGFLFDCSGLPYSKGGFIIEANNVYTLNLCIIGFMSAYSAMFIEAVRRMADEGFGHPMVPLKLCDITEKGPYGLDTVQIAEPYKRIELEFLTPVLLMRASELNGNGYQGKMNNFPSFYQFMRSMAYRMISLNILYAGDNTFSSRDETDSFIDRYISDATHPMLVNAGIHYAKRHSTPKKGADHVYVMEGYVGSMAFKDVPSKYIPVLMFASAFGIGNDINFGMGTYRIKFNTKNNL